MQTLVFDVRGITGEGPPSPRVASLPQTSEKDCFAPPSAETAQHPAHKDWALVLLRRTMIASRERSWFIQMATNGITFKFIVATIINTATIAEAAKVKSWTPAFQPELPRSRR